VQCMREGKETRPCFPASQGVRGPNNRVYRQEGPNLGKKTLKVGNSGYGAKSFWFSKGLRSGLEEHVEGGGRAFVPKGARPACLEKTGSSKGCGECSKTEGGCLDGNQQDCCCQSLGGGGRVRSDGLEKRGGGETGKRERGLESYELEGREGYWLHSFEGNGEKEEKAGTFWRLRKE